MTNLKCRRLGKSYLAELVKRMMLYVLLLCRRWMIVVGLMCRVLMRLVVIRLRVDLFDKLDLVSVLVYYLVA